MRNIKKQIPIKIRLIINLLCFILSNNMHYEYMQYLLWKQSIQKRWGWNFLLLLALLLFSAAC